MKTILIALALCVSTGAVAKSLNEIEADYNKMIAGFKATEKGSALRQSKAAKAEMYKLYGKLPRKKRSYGSWSPVDDLAARLLNMEVREEQRLDEEKLQYRLKNWK